MLPKAPTFSFVSRLKPEAGGGLGLWQKLQSVLKMSFWLQVPLTLMQCPFYFIPAQCPFRVNINNSPNLTLESNPTHRDKEYPWPYSRATTPKEPQETSPVLTTSPTTQPVSPILTDSPEPKPNRQTKDLPQQSIQDTQSPVLPTLWIGLNNIWIITEKRRKLGQLSATQKAFIPWKKVEICSVSHPKKIIPPRYAN